MKIIQAIKSLKSYESLSFEFMTAVLDEIFNQNCSDQLTRDFLVALHAKGEVRDEIWALVRFLKQHGHKAKVRSQHVIDCCGTGGDAKNTFNISTAVAFVLAGGGCAVAKHGNRAVSSQSGSADILSELGVNINAPSEIMARCIDEIGIGFLFAPQYYPNLKKIADIRKSIPHRTIFNCVGPLLNPAQAKRQLIGVFDAKLTSIVAEIARLEGCESAMIVHGDDGMDEFTLTTINHVSRLKNECIENFIFDPRESGYEYCVPGDLVGGTSSQNADRLKLSLKGHSRPLDHVVHINAAWGFVVAEKADTFLDGLLMAQDSISSGRAYQKLEALIEATR